jgi:uncharacterized protein YkwD
MNRPSLLVPLLWIACSTHQPTIETVPQDVLATGDTLADAGTGARGDLGSGPMDLLADSHMDLLADSPMEMAREPDLPTDGGAVEELAAEIAQDPCAQPGPCDDGDPCTGGETCQNGICVPATIQLSLGCLYVTPPAVAACDPGTLSAGAQAVALSRVNQLRALSGLPPVAYDNASSPMLQETALIMAANSALSHEPPMQWNCWTQDGFAGAGASNLHLLWNTEAKLPDPVAAVDAFLIDKGVESLGHRRWLLDPFLKQTAFGAVHGKPTASSPYPHVWSAALRVIYSNVTGTSAAVDFVAYPLGDYPAALVDKDWYLSFSMLASKKQAYDNVAVDLSQATVKVTKVGGGMLSVVGLTRSNDFFGNPNHLQWKVIGLQNNVTYTVAISGLVYQGKSSNFQYEFTLVP